MAPKRDRLIGRARELYAAGLTHDEVARALAVHPSTVNAWAAYDRGRDLDWEKAREERRRTRPGAVLRKLKARFARALDASGQAEGDAVAETEDRLLKLTRIIESYSKFSGGISARLRVMEEFADFCAAELDPERLAAVRAAMAAYLGRVKNEADR